MMITTTTKASNNFSSSKYANHETSAREQFRAKLAHYRKRTGMSQGALATAIGYSQNRFSERLNGRDNAAMFTIPEVVAIVRYLDTHNAFFTGNERADLLYTAYPQATSTAAPSGLAAPAAATGYADDGSSSNNSGNSNPCQVILSATTTTTITTTATFTLNATSTNALDSLPETATARAGAGSELSDDFDFGELTKPKQTSHAPTLQLQIQIQEETLRELARLIYQHLAAAQVQESGTVVTSLPVNLGLATGR